MWVEGAWHSGAPNTPGLRKGPFLFVSGAVPIDLATGESVGTDIGEQTAQVIDNIEAVLKGAGCSFQDVVKVTVYMTDLADFGKMNDVMAARFGQHKPARTTIQAARLPSGATLEIDVVARVP